MERLPKRGTLTFIVRVWTEYLHEQPSRCCGVVEVAASGTKSYFVGLEEMAAFIQQQAAGQSGTEPPG